MSENKAQTCVNFLSCRQVWVIGEYASPAHDNGCTVQNIVQYFEVSFFSWPFIYVSIFFSFLTYFHHFPSHRTENLKKYSTLTYLLKSCIFRFPRSKYWPYVIKARPSCCLSLWPGSCPSTLTGGSVVATKTGSHMRRCISTLVNLAHILAFKLLRLMNVLLFEEIFVCFIIFSRTRLLIKC